MPHELLVRWRRAAERLSLTPLAAPEVFQRSLELVGRTVDHLRGPGPGDAPLLTASSRGARLVFDALDLGAPGGPLPVDLDVVADAALARRHRQVLAERTAQRRIAALHAAHARGQAWVVLETSGDPAGSPFVPYRRLEAHASTGRAVLVTTGPDVDLTRSLHAVEAVLVDLESGALCELRDDRVAATTHVDAHEREQQAAVLQQQLAGLSGTLAQRGSFTMVNASASPFVPPPSS